MLRESEKRESGASMEPQEETVKATCVVAIGRRHLSRKWRDGRRKAGSSRSLCCVDDDDEGWKESHAESVTPTISSFTFILHSGAASPLDLKH